MHEGMNKRMNGQCDKNFIPTDILCMSGVQILACLFFLYMPDIKFQDPSICCF